MNPFPHQYILRSSGEVITEQPIADRTVHFLYHQIREKAPIMFNMLISRQMSGLLAWFQYDFPAGRGSGEELFRRIGADPAECVEPLSFFDSYRKLFERRIRYPECRPMGENVTEVVSPADSRLLLGSFTETKALFIKEKFFDLKELLGGTTQGTPEEAPNGTPRRTQQRAPQKTQTNRWPERFGDGDFAVFRLTPDKYHYNHLPVSGKVLACYQLDGGYHSCNPTTFIALGSLYAKNRREVTLIDTDVEGGSQVGVVAMVEIVALMIGDMVQCYSEEGYENPMPLRPGMFCKKGAPKSLFRPGSSTVVLLFEPGRVCFDDDLVNNSRRSDLQSRFSTGLGKPLVETDVLLRSTIGRRALSQHVTQPFQG